MSNTPRRRWETVLDDGVQHERTALAWERTALAAMVAGLLLARHAAQHSAWVAAAAGLAETAVGAALLAWTGERYDDLHGPIQAGTGIVHPTAARIVGLSTVAFTAIVVVFTAVQLATG